MDCFTDNIINARKQATGYPFLITEYNCGWKNNDIHDGESKSYAAAFAFRTVNALKGTVDALSWWTFSSIFEEGGLPTNEFGPFGANSAMQTVHGVPLPVRSLMSCSRARAYTHIHTHARARARVLTQLHI